MSMRIALCLVLVACGRPVPAVSEAAPAVVPHADVAESIYDGGLQNGWQDWGWAPHELKPGAPATVHFDQYGGWMLAKGGLHGAFGGLTFRVKEPIGEGEFLEVHLLSPGSAKLPSVKISPDDRTDVGDGWAEVFLPMARLNPNGEPFDRIVLQAFRPLDAQPIPIDKIALTRSAPAPAGGPVTNGTAARVPIRIDCRAKASKISPLIYGMALDDQRQQAQWNLGATVRRWGGNLSSNYNWEIGAWNTGNDWFFENHEAASFANFLADDRAHGVLSAVTVPLMGWVAKDKTSFSFPVSLYGPQDATDPWHPDVGNGKEKGSGKPLSPGPQTRAFVAVTPDFVRRWIESLTKEDAANGKRSVAMVVLDNEPMLWSTTHRDAHPSPLSYDELLQRTIDYATAIRQADPAAVIAGPAEWGWTNYFYSAKDMAMGGTTVRLDRRAHDDLPLVAYYLKTLADREKSSGVRLLDVLDLHGYPYGDRVYGDASDDQVAALRIRSTRMLWDPTYVDESWVKEPIRLLPRMREWVDQYYPGRGISLGEWNFGGEGHMSGALATAEALGRFAQFGLTSAFYWTCPPDNSPTMWAFRAYRNYDGKGGRFLDWFTPTTVDSRNASLFASRDETGNHLVAVALNFSPQDDVSADVDLSSCGSVESVQAYAYGADGQGLTALDRTGPVSGHLVHRLGRYSITILDIQLASAAAVVK